MTTDEPARLHLYERARIAMDDEAAKTLMSGLPWDVAELATKQDLGTLRHDVIAATLKGVFAMNIGIAGFGIAVAQLVR